jgi:hypothetical protein
MDFHEILSDSLRCRNRFFFPLFGMMGAVLADVHAADRVFQDVFLCRFIRIRCFIMVIKFVLLNILLSFHVDFIDHALFL